MWAIVLLSVVYFAVKEKQDTTTAYRCKICKEIDQKKDWNTRGAFNCRKLITFLSARQCYARPGEYGKIINAYLECREESYNMHDYTMIKEHARRWLGKCYDKFDYTLTDNNIIIFLSPDCDVTGCD